MYQDTIAAISTPIGEGGIGIVRLSGKDALTIAQRLFSQKLRGLTLQIQLCSTYPPNFEMWY
jgi:tRNA modification GTPase